MKFLHTADWHVGLTLKGRSRLDEQRAVLRQIVAIAREHEVDAVLVAGDLYDSAAPTPDAQQLVVQTLVALAQTGAAVVALAGNHDNPVTMDAYRPVMAAAGITVAGRVRSPAAANVVEFTARSTGERGRVALVPFISQRYAVNAAELVANTPADNSAAYDQRVRNVITAVTSGFAADTVNIVMSHLMVTGGTLGGGEREGQSVFEYYVPATAFPATAHYVALGHLHRRQVMPAPAPVHYSGSPLPVDFGEAENLPVVCVVEAGVDSPARVTDVPVTAHRRLLTLRGTVADVLGRADEAGEAYLRVWIQQPSYAGLRDDILTGLPNTLEVRIDPAFTGPDATTRPSHDSVATRSPADLFAEFCRGRGIADRRIEELFASLHEDVTSAGPGG